ncbi:MAG: glycine/betaine/sarcosine/D-proline family reductase selenoprotein B [Desulfobacula sp.]|nr:glycine/betaine/sarcosine/D-proline family reductase selenoprotein B [Desulfobacula sp.]
MENDQPQESFEAFTKSFFYGTRSDLSFKFLSDLTPHDASTFLQHLFSDLVDAIDDNDIEKIKKRLLSGQLKGYENQKNFDYDDGPFHLLTKPASSLNFTLLTSSGHFVLGQDPQPLGVEGMTQKEAEKRIFDFLKEKPQLSEIPFEIQHDQLMVRHGGYDTRAAQKDANVSFPYQGMTVLKQQGKINSLTPNAYSFVGACSQVRLLKQTLSGWIEKLKQQNVDAMVMVPV